MNVITLTQSQLNKSSVRDFNNKDRIRVGKYLIFVEDGNWGKNVNTYAESDDNPMMPMTEGKMPKFLRSFIFER